MKITIIGAGIAGLTLGLACQRAGIDVKIFEKADELRTIGGGILLWPHGLRFLNELGLADCLQPAWMSVKSTNIISHRGQHIFGDELGEINALLGGEILPIDRAHVQQQLAAQLDAGTLVTGKTCLRVETRDDGARTIFADGSEDHADLVVGADGIHSVVRASIFPEAKSTYTGFCWWGGIVAADVVPNFPINEVQYILGQGKICSIWPTHGKRFMWYLPIKISLDSFDREDEGHLLARELCHGWNDDVQRIIAAPQQAQRFHVPINELPPQQLCYSGRTVLIGDAASAFGPLLGQGANKAIEDAYLLAALLRQHPQNLPQNLAGMLKHYNEMRRARHQRFFDLERMSADALIHETPEALQFFEEQLPKINLVMMYQDMIPLVNEAACDELRGYVMECGL